MSPELTGSPEITVCLVEDDSGISGHLSFLLTRAPGIRLLQAFSTAEAALERIPDLHPNVVVMDIQLPGMTGIDCVRRLKEIYPPAQVLMLTVYDDTDRIFQALAAGACGYLLKRTSLSQLIESIREVHLGGSPFTSHIARKVVQYFHKAPPASGRDVMTHLSPREREVLELLAQGEMYKEIADRLGLALDTVRKHVRSIYEKLHVRSRTEAVVKLLRR